MSIPQVSERTYRIAVIVGFVVLMVSFGFACGYIVAQSNNPAPIIIEKCAV